jgi:PPOX class probable F420-dependent enzyme
MMKTKQVPEKYHDLLTGANFAHLGTLMPDGSPQVTPIWFKFDGEFIWFNSAKGRQKDKNVKADPRVSFSIIDPANGYRYVELRGKVVEVTEEGADALIDELAKKYMGVDAYPFRSPTEIRVSYKVEIEHSTSMG